MKKTLITLCLLALSANVSANETHNQDMQQVESKMEQLVTVTEASDFFITIDEEASFESIEYTGFIIVMFSEIYITKHQAEERNLEQAQQFHIYGETDLEVVSQRIAAQIDQDNPTFFSIDLYRDYHGTSGQFTYVAKVVEYK